MAIEQHDVLLVNPQGTRLVISSRLADFTQVLEGANRAELFEAFEQWRETGGIEQLESLLKEVNKLSPAALSDGNPQSATARITHGAYDAFAWEFAPGRRLRLDPNARYGEFSAQPPAGTVNGSEWLINLPLYAPITDRASFAATLLGEYTNIEGTEIFGGGANLGLALELVPAEENLPLSWTATPFVGSYLRGSFHSASGVLLVNGGLANRVEWSGFEDISLYYAGAINYASSVSVRLFGTNFETGLRQFILKNGLGARYEMSNVTLGGGLILTNFLNNVAVDHYWTGDLEINWRVDEHWTIGLTAQADLASRYQGINGGPRVEMAF